VLKKKEKKKTKKTQSPKSTLKLPLPISLLYLFFSPVAAQFGSISPAGPAQPPSLCQSPTTGAHSSTLPSTSSHLLSSTLPHCTNSTQRRSPPAPPSLPSTEHALNGQWCTTAIPSFPLPKRHHHAFMIGRPTTELHRPTVPLPLPLLAV
jgi:hypothetical protein